MEPKAEPEEEAQSEAGKRGNAIRWGQNTKAIGSDNITPDTQRGTSDTYLLRRLKRDHPALAEQVVVAGSKNAVKVKDENAVDNINPVSKGRAGAHLVECVITHQAR